MALKLWPWPSWLHGTRVGLKTQKLDFREVGTWTEPPGCGDTLGKVYLGTANALYQLSAPGVFIECSSFFKGSCALCIPLEHACTLLWGTYILPSLLQSSEGPHGTFNQGSSEQPQRTFLLPLSKQSAVNCLSEDLPSLSLNIYCHCHLKSYYMCSWNSYPATQKEPISFSTSFLELWLG